MKKNNTISPWLGTLNLVTPTSYEANGGLRRDVDYFQHRRVNRTLCVTSHQQVIGGFSDTYSPVVLLIVWAAKIWVNN